MTQENNQVNKVMLSLNSNFRFSNDNTNTQISSTTTTLLRCLTCHLSNDSSIKTHIINQHKGKAKHEIKQILSRNPKVQYHINCKTRLQLLEELRIKSKQPRINKIISNLDPTYKIYLIKKMYEISLEYLKRDKRQHAKQVIKKVS